MRALRVAARMLMGVLSLLGIISLIQATTPLGGSEATTIVTSARAPDPMITTAAMVALITTALFITIVLAMQVLRKQRSTLKWKIRSAIRPFTKANFYLLLSKLAFSPFKDVVGLGHRQLHAFLNRARGLGSHAYRAAVPFPNVAI